jgi:hypothetical protein
MNKCFSQKLSISVSISSVKIIWTLNIFLTWPSCFLKLEYNVNKIKTNFTPYTTPQTDKTCTRTHTHTHTHIYIYTHTHTHTPIFNINMKNCRQTKIFIGTLAAEVNTNCNMLPYSRNRHLSSRTIPSLESLANLHFQCSEDPISKTSGHQYSYWSPRPELYGLRHRPLQTNFKLLYRCLWGAQTSLAVLSNWVHYLKLTAVSKNRKWASWRVVQLKPMWYC